MSVSCGVCQRIFVLFWRILTGLYVAPSRYTCECGANFDEGKATVPAENRPVRSRKAGNQSMYNDSSEGSGWDY